MGRRTLPGEREGGGRTGALSASRTTVVGGRALATGLALLATSCGAAASTGGLTPSQPWLDSLGDVFDDGFDFVAPLRSILGTPWFDEYGAQLERRLDESDVVAVVALRSIVPPAERGFGAVEVEVVEPLIGGIERGAVLHLDVVAGSAAADRIVEERPHIEATSRFVAYVRLYADELSATRTHWHLSPDDPDLVNTIRRAVGPARQEGGM
ncbi:MAG: hypothetical protein HY907_04135 [Deltaproteobacteria bacterium]|nr:hypothetical protein [Deltaproteobacteria bacterium]